MGGGTSKENADQENDGQSHPFESVEAALAAGKSKDEVDAYMAESAVDSSIPNEDIVPAAAPATGNEAGGEASGASEDEVDRSEIERNKNGCEEPSSSDPELWNIDNCEVDILVKYKMGGQMWYVQSRMRENTAKNPPKPIPGFPMNKKAEAAKRFYSKDDEEFNVGSTNFTDAKGWKVIEANNPPAPVRA
jgi:hypothetical protein